MSFAESDPVFRFKDRDFFQAGRNNAEARFWSMKIHEEDRRGVKSSIDLGGSDGDSVKEDIASETRESVDDIDEEGKGQDEEKKDEDLEREDDVRSLTKSPTPARDYHDKYSYEPSQEPKEYYHYEAGGGPGERRMSVVSTRSSRYSSMTPSRDYQYSYPGEQVRRSASPTPSLASVASVASVSSYCSQRPDARKISLAKLKREISEVNKAKEEKSVAEKHMSSRFY